MKDQRSMKYLCIQLAGGWSHDGVHAVVQHVQQAGAYERNKYTTWCKHRENAEISQSLIKLLFHQLFRYQFYSLKLHQNVDLTQQNELSVKLRITFVC